MAKIFTFTQWDRMFHQFVESAEGKLAESGATVGPRRFKKSIKVASYPTIPILDLTEEAVRNAALQTVRSITREVKYNNLKHISPLRIVPAHTPEKLRAGWAVYVEYEDENMKDIEPHGGPTAFAISRLGSVPVSIGPFGKPKD